MAKKLSQSQQLAADLQYKAFLEKRLDSKNYKSRVSPEEYQQTKEKYDKLKLRLKLLYPNLRK